MLQIAGQRLGRAGQAVRSPWYYFPVCENPRHFRGLGWRAPVWSVIFGISALAGKVSGAGLCSPFSNFRLAVAETGSIADRDRFAGRPSGIRQTPAIAMK